MHLFLQQFTSQKVLFQNFREKPLLGYLMAKSLMESSFIRLIKLDTLPISYPAFEETSNSHQLSRFLLLRLTTVILIFTFGGTKVLNDLWCQLKML